MIAPEGNASAPFIYSAASCWYVLREAGQTNFLPSSADVDVLQIGLDKGFVSVLVGVN